MKIKINGKEEITEAKLLSELLKQKSLCFEKIVVEYNFNIVPKNEWNNIALAQDDNVEIVSFVAGG